MKKMLSIMMSVCLACAFLCANQDKGKIYPPAQVLKIWEGVQMPGGTTEPLDYSKSKHTPERINVKNATLSFYPAKNAKDGGLVIVCPGGGYSNLWTVWHEGTKVAKFLNEKGISAAVLEYRVPQNFDGALMDAQRAIRLVRANAKKWNVNPEKVAIMGFSAGASLSARAATNFKTDSYAPLDEADKLCARPDCAVLIYPAYCSQPEKDRRMGKPKTKSEDYSEKYAIADWNVVDKDTPPAFITQSQFDPYVDASIAYYLALKKFGVPAELHMISKGKHGYKDPAMFELLAEYLKERGF